ncbi:MAG TPA: response regulator [Candidatus Hydrogenedentes bacterium]|nr:response regulator [Candidatus Hydrogenedentota bacterium]
MIKILFVDDEPNVLDGLRRMLHSMAGVWDMRFLTDPFEALQAIQDCFFDIIVSDLRMPEMDGAVLLQEVRHRSPETVRIALSGYSDQASTLRAVSQMHQFLAKPCAPDELIAILNRATVLGNLLTNKRLKRILSEMESLPSLVTLYDDIVQELERPEPSAPFVGELIARDAAMSAKVLQLVNSALFGLPNIVSDPVHATLLLGLDTLHALVFSIKIFDQFTAETVGGLSVPDLWNHCVSVARLAKRIAMAQSAPDAVAETAFLGGLLHDIGKIVLATDTPELYANVLSESQHDHAAIISLEESALGGNHAEVGGYLMGLWGFSEPIIEAIYMHHDPAKSPSTSFGALAAVHVANGLCHLLKEPEASLNNTIDHAFLERLGLNRQVPIWMDLATQTLGKENDT